MTDRTEQKINALVNLLVSKIDPADEDRVFFFNQIKAYIVLTGACEHNFMNEHGQVFINNLMNGAGLKLCA